MKRSQPRRIWTTARRKCDEERRCRGCGLSANVQAAHIIGRERDFYTLDGQRKPGPTITVHAVRVVPLCPDCHRAFDGHGLDLIGKLSPEEEAQAVLDAGGLELARKRLLPSAYRDKVGVA